MSERKIITYFSQLSDLHHRIWSTSAGPACTLGPATSSQDQNNSCYSHSLPHRVTPVLSTFLHGTCEISQAFVAAECLCLRYSTVRHCPDKDALATPLQPIS